MDYVNLGLTGLRVSRLCLGHLADALAAEQLPLGADEMQRLEELYQPHAVAGHQ